MSWAGEFWGCVTEAAATAVAYNQGWKNPDDKYDFECELMERLMTKDGLKGAVEIVKKGVIIGMCDALAWSMRKCENEDVFRTELERGWEFAFGEPIPVRLGPRELDYRVWKGEITPEMLIA